SSGGKHLTIFWISPVKGQLKKLHLRWQTLILGILILIIGIGLGIGGVLFYQTRTQRALSSTYRELRETRQTLAVLEKQKKEQEERIRNLTQETERVLQELNAVRELDKKVRELLEKDLQSRLKKLGISLSLASTDLNPCVPVHRFLEGSWEAMTSGAGGPLFSSLVPLPPVSSLLAPPYDPNFHVQIKTLEDNLLWLKTEIFLRKKSLEEVIDVVHKKDRLLDTIPMRWPSWGKISSRYGWRRDPFTGQRAWHTGIDIAGPSGRSVVATAEGKVVFAGWNGNYGKCVIVRHQFGYETVYGHLSRILVNPGDSVKKNEVIGKIGSTGRSTGPHLHYEVRRYGNVINPWPHLP
ncbi:MAG: peptidoglycan DD-metalloendopeptidase family protein, partial [Atribacterota bacterium]|nr:peptidoglycan DD-metalloendopeptidase family protein [Atribacterota bacterium]